MCHMLWCGISNNEWLYMACDFVKCCAIFFMAYEKFTLYYIEAGCSRTFVKFSYSIEVTLAIARDW